MSFRVHLWIVDQTGLHVSWLGQVSQGVICDVVGHLLIDYFTPLCNGLNYFVTNVMCCLSTGKLQH